MRQSNWQRHFFYKKGSIKTTWKLRLGIFILVILIGSATRGFWAGRIGRSLVCTEEIGQSDIILVENFNPSFLAFERASELRRAQISLRILVPVQTSHDGQGANIVSQGIAELMCRVARIPDPEIIPIREIEPISLNAAYQIRAFLVKEHLKSVIIVTPAFRSKRSSLIYHAVLDPSGIEVRCLPVFGKITPENWTGTWHGVQEVTQQFLKLQFYRFYVLLKRSTSEPPASEKL